jgi:hypothetical protein
MIIVISLNTNYIHQAQSPKYQIDFNVILHYFHEHKTIYNQFRRIKLEINRDASAIASGEIAIDADPQVVWNIMTAIEDWPEWNPDVKEAELLGELTPGTEFHWKSGPGTIKSTLQEVKPGQKIAWTGRTMGIHAVHVWWLTPENGKTMVQTEESWEGLIVRLLKGRMQKMLQEAIDSGLTYLKNAAEKHSKTDQISN